MKLIDKLRLYSRAKCPLVGIPFSNGKKIVLSRPHLIAALGSPVITAKLVDSGVLLTGNGARYLLYDLHQSQGILTVYQTVYKWADSQRAKRQRVAIKPAKHSLMDTLLKLERQVKLQFPRGEPTPPVSPLLRREGYNADRELFLQWHRNKQIRKDLSRLLARKNNSAEGQHMTWAMFYMEFERIVGRPPMLRHTQKAFSTYGRGGKAVFYMTGEWNPHSSDPSPLGDWKVRYRESQLKFLVERREYQTLQSLIADLEARINAEIFMGEREDQ